MGLMIDDVNRIYQGNKVHFVDDNTTRSRAVGMKNKGISNENIGESLGCTPEKVKEMLNRPKKC